MNTWLGELIKDVNERTFSGAELDRMMVYYQSFPARVKAAEEIEQLESELNRTLIVTMRKAHPERTLYTKRLITDLIEGLRPMVLAVLADEPRLFRQRWIRHVSRVVQELGIDPDEIRDVYVQIGEAMTNKLTAGSMDMVQPLLDELLDALTVPASAY